MAMFNVPHARISTRFRIMTAAGGLAVALACCPITAGAQTASGTPPPSNQATNSQDARLREEWRITMAQVPLPKQGCFQSSYPEKAWKETACTRAPDYPMPPRIGPRPLVVGNGDDISGQAPSGFIATAIGSFDSVTNVTSESSPIGNSGTPVANAYTLQVNTNFFPGTACAGSPNPGCRGWEQFVFENTGTIGRAFIQYWLIRYNAPCPGGVGWNQFSFTNSTDIYCYKNNPGGAVSVPQQPITNLGLLSLSGAVTATTDTVTMSVGGTLYARNGDNAVNAAAGWQIAEFNVFGDGGSSAGGGAATFNAGAAIVPRTRIIYGGTAAPICVAQGFTGETNNLSFGPTAPGGSAPGPAVIFSESTAGGSPSNCAAAATVGDTHLATFGGLLYDFQASGDFVLAQADPDFVVQARQVSGAPSWPDASVNSAIATRMGKSRVAVCLSPARLNVDGKNRTLDDGASLSTPDGVDIWRRGNVYFILDQSGNSVRATLNANHIDVSVGLGQWPTKVTGLLANVNNNVNALAMRDGTVLTNPFSFEAFYGRYGESWRVKPEESLLSACGDRNIERGNPKKIFEAKHLDPKLFERVRAVCLAAGVKAGPLLDACTLDVAVIGDDAAAKVFVDAHTPLAVGKFVETSSTDTGPPRPWWWWLVVVAVIAVVLLLVLRARKP